MSAVVNKLINALQAGPCWSSTVQPTEPVASSLKHCKSNDTGVRVGRANLMQLGGAPASSSPPD